MRYVVYGEDAGNRRPRAPLVVEATCEDEARGRAVAGGMTVRAVIAETQPAEEPLRADAPQADVDDRPSPPSEGKHAPRAALMVLVPLVFTLVAILAAVRTLMQAMTWSVVWLLGVLAGAGIAGIISGFGGGTIPVTTAWPAGVTMGLALASGMHGARIGWRWWWAKRSLSPLAQALGAAPEDADDAEPRFLRVPVLLAQGLAGAVLGSVGGLMGWATDWSMFTVPAWTVGGALGLGVEGAILGAVLARRRPIAPPGTPPGPVFESFATLLARRGAGHWAVGYAIERAVPGAVAGTFIGVVAFLLGWWVTGE